MLCKPKKRLGQNFLVDKNVQRKIITACEFAPRDTVLEIGAGQGELTRLISPLVREIYALEIDACLCRILREDLRTLPNVKIINADILKFDLKKYFTAKEGISEKGIKVAGNIPYYISSPIIGRLFKFRSLIDTVFLTVQKEFAGRMASGPGSKEYGSLSCFTQYYSNPKILFSIKNNSFFPVPKVDSCLVRLDIKKGLILEAGRERLLFKIIRCAFNQRRKTLRNSLEGVVSRRKLGSFFERYGIPRDTRPEKLSLSDFIALAQ